jgi:hypothetical protein
MNHVVVNPRHESRNMNVKKLRGIYEHPQRNWRQDRSNTRAAARSLCVLLAPAGQAAQWAALRQREAGRSWQGRKMARRSNRHGSRRRCARPLAAATPLLDAPAASGRSHPCCRCARAPAPRAWQLRASSVPSHNRLVAFSEAPPPSFVSSLLSCKPPIPRATA